MIRKDVKEKWDAIQPGDYDKMNQLHKKDMHDIFGGEKQTTKENKKDIFSWCSNILRQ